jgi:uncharacterized protein YwgA
MLLEAMQRFGDEYEPVSSSIAVHLCYFLQKLGDPFDGGVKFDRSFSGPYSPAVNHVVYHMNGTFVTGLE